MNCYVENLIKIAKDEIGYLEKASNNNLDSKTANAGSNNFTKYARDLDNISGFYNGKKQGYAWCSVFVGWCFIKAFGVENAKRLLCQPDNSLGAGCEYSMRYYKNVGRFRTSPAVGDQIFFKDSSGIACHTGIVYAVDKSYVYTIEGNTSSASGVVANGGGVFQKKYSLNYSRILGYGHPAYDIPKGGTCTMELNVLRKGNKGGSVKALQILLIGNGYSCGATGADGDFGTGTHNAVIKFQSAKKISADGIVGAQTWGKILGIA